MPASNFSTCILAVAILFLCISAILLIPTGIIRIVRTYRTRHNESYKPNLRFKFDVDIAWYIGQIALFIGGVMGIVGFIFAAVLG